MDLKKFNDEIKKIKGIIQALDVDGLVHNFEVIGNLKGILNEVYDDIKIYESIKSEVTKVDSVLRDRMQDRNEAIREIVNKIKEKEINSI